MIVITLRPECTTYHTTKHIIIFVICKICIKIVQINILKSQVYFQSHPENNYYY